MSKKDLFITKNGKYIDKFTLSTSELRLLAAGDGVEIMTQSINEGVMFRVTPAAKSHTLEFFYVLEGELEYQAVDSDDVKKMNSGDSFSAQNLGKDYTFKTMSNCQLLYVSSEPVFHMIGDQMKDLHRLNAELESKDSYTKGHSERVHNYSIEIATEMGLNRESMLQVAFAALFHDIGKIDVPAEILKKGDALNDEEYLVIKDHPTKGANLIKKVKYKDVSKIVAQHHERLDGSGYPKGLTEDEICLEARIIAIADAYDAMTTDRPYRKGWEQERAISELKKWSGVTYDAEVVSAFERYLKKKNKKRG